MSNYDTIIKTTNIVKALLMNYELKCSDGTIIKIDSNNNTWIKGLDNNCILDALVDIKFLVSEANKISEEEDQKIEKYIEKRELAVKLNEMLNDFNNNR